MCAVKSIYMLEINIALVTSQHTFGIADIKIVKNIFKMLIIVDLRLKHTGLVSRY